jgi:hypothetical protein
MVDEENRPALGAFLKPVRNHGFSRSESMPVNEVVNRGEVQVIHETGEVGGFLAGPFSGGFFPNAGHHITIQARAIQKGAARSRAQITPCQKREPSSCMGLLPFGEHGVGDGVSFLGNLSPAHERVPVA